MFLPRNVDLNQVEELSWLSSPPLHFEVLLSVRFLVGSTVLCHKFIWPHSHKKDMLLSKWWRSFNSKVYHFYLNDTWANTNSWEAILTLWMTSRCTEVIALSLSPSLSLLLPSISSYVVLTHENVTHCYSLVNCSYMIAQIMDLIDFLLQSLNTPCDPFVYLRYPYLSLPLSRIVLS